MEVTHVHGREDLGAGVLADVHPGGDAGALVGRARGEVQVVGPDPDQHRAGGNAIGEPPGDAVSDVGAHAEGLDGDRPS